MFGCRVEELTLEEIVKGKFSRSFETILGRNMEGCYVLCRRKGVRLKEILNGHFPELQVQSGQLHTDEDLDTEGSILY